MALNVTVGSKLTLSSLAAELDKHSGKFDKQELRVKGDTLYSKTDDTKAHNLVLRWERRTAAVDTLRNALMTEHGINHKEASTIMKNVFDGTPSKVLGEDVAKLAKLNADVALLKAKGLDANTAFAVAQAFQKGNLSTDEFVKLPSYNHGASDAQQAKWSEFATCLTKNFSGKDLKQMDVSLKTSCYAALQNDAKASKANGDKDAEKAARLAAIEISKGFAKSELRGDDLTRLGKVYDKIKADPDLKDTLTNWKDASVGDKESALRKIAGFHAEAFGRPAPAADFLKVKAETVKDKDGKSIPDRYTEGEFNPGHGTSPDELVLNSNHNTFKDPAHLVAVTLHELTHAHQAHLKAEMKAGNIGPTHADYARALITEADDMVFHTTEQLQNCGIDKDTAYALYKSAPSENHAFNITKHSWNEMRSILA